ncbi:unnamed protein product [Prorocentrum cordatum]|uniref:Endonuclease/exonuclease/phosphatase domain-containing protein n=1 Tax=Prorocentrum cordatum TaxID=2364126 RepID=A0ABN9Y3T7_9DINO|nr:unnamed protein product [Polarella glacialis]
MHDGPRAKRPRHDPAGGDDAGGDADQPMESDTTPDPMQLQARTINVTSLAKARRTTILSSRDAMAAGIVCLQEIRQRELRPRHGMVGIRAARATVLSTYGPAELDRDWFHRSFTFFRTLGHLGHPIFIAGDLNWRPTYAGVIGHGWRLDTAADGSPSTTTTVNTCPTRALFWGSPDARPPLHTNTTLLAGIPHHGLVSYTLNVPYTEQTTHRLRQTATYAPARDAPPEERALMQELIDLEFHAPLISDDDDSNPPLTDRWDYWHLRAEQAMLVAVDRGCMQLDQLAERPKGSKPTTRRTLHSPAHRLDQSIALLRLQRLHRALAEHLRQGGRSDDYLAPRHHRSVAQAALDGVLNAQACGTPCYSDALHWIYQATSAEQARLQDGANRQRRQRFATWSNDLWSYTTPMFKATPPTPAMNVHDMRRQWHDQWCPDNYDGDSHHQRWKTYEADTVFPKSDKASDWTPSWGQFREAIQRAKGCLGLDGWSCKELRALAHWFPAIVRELFDLWTAAPTAAAQAKGHLSPDLP